MHPVRTAATLAVVCLLGLAAVGPALAGAPVDPAGRSQSLAPTVDASQVGERSVSGPGFLQTSVDPDAVVMRADTGTDGTAEWTVEYRLRLDDDNATAAFESVQSDIEANSTAFTSRFADGMRRTVWSAENATGREMALRNVTVTAERQTFGQEYGVITYRFTWTNFATTDGDRLRVGDALSKLFLDSETTLVFAYPDGYTVETVHPRPTENRTDAVVWRGPIDFGPEEPRLVVAPGGASGSILPFVAGGAVILLVVAAAGWVLSRRGGEEPLGEATAGAETGDTAAAGGEGAASGGEVSGAAEAGGDAGEPGAEEPPAELLSNEERVIKLLNESGGRVKQQQIASEFDWTDAKTSQVVGNLRDDDAVETFRIGRENVVTLPEESDLIDDDR